MSLVFVGAGGSGVSALVQLMIELKIPEIVCIDCVDSSYMESFRKTGATTFTSHGQYQVKTGDTIIYSAATNQSPEVKAGFALTYQDHLSSPPMLYAEFLGELSKYLYTIAISGTHGKSTTTGMVATTCIKQLPETALAIVGAGVTERQGKHCWHSNSYVNELRAVVSRIISRKATGIQVDSDKLIFIIEADEFNHHFLFLEPKVSIITSLDHDHVDIYPTRDSYLDAFIQFCANTKQRIFTLPHIKQELITKSEESKVKIVVPSEEQFSFAHIVGGHNHKNASLALATVAFVREQYDNGANNELKTTLEHFQGLQRRGELLGNNRQRIAIFSDYGHHPDEIKSTLQAFQEKYPDTPITCFFEAHQARRLLAFWDEFVQAFVGRSCFVVPAYTARETKENLQTYYQELGSNPHLPENKSDFESMTQAFATQVHGVYLSNWKELAPALHGVRTGLILCFSAGVLDSKLRSVLNIE